MIQRTAAKKLMDLAVKFKAVAVTGARQTGKTTLVRQLFKDKHDNYWVLLLNFAFPSPSLIFAAQ